MEYSDAVQCRNFIILGRMGKLTNADGIAIGSQNLGDTQVTDDNILLLLDKTENRISIRATCGDR